MLEGPWLCWKARERRDTNYERNAPTVPKPKMMIKKNMEQLPSHIQSGLKQRSGGRLLLSHTSHGVPKQVS